MSIKNQQAATGEYTLAEAANTLGWAGSTLRDRVTANSVPHHRLHAVRGIFFTDEDLAQIRALGRRQPATAALDGTLAAAGHGTGENAAMDAALAALAAPTRVPRSR